MRPFISGCCGVSVETEVLFDERPALLALVMAAFPSVARIGSAQPLDRRHGGACALCGLVVFRKVGMYVTESGLQPIVLQERRAAGLPGERVVLCSGLRPGPALRVLAPLSSRAPCGVRGRRHGSMSGHARGPAASELLPQIEVGLGVEAQDLSGARPWARRVGARQATGCLLRRRPVAI